MKTENYIREFYFIFFAQRRIIIITTSIFFISALLIAFLWPPIYSATGAILAKAKKAEKTPEAIENVELRPFPISKEDLASEMEIIMSPDVIGRTVKALQEKNLYRKNIPLSDAVYAIKQKLKTEIVPASNVIVVTYFSKDPQNSVAVLDALMNQYIHYRMLVYSPAEAEKFYSQQADHFRDSLRKDEKDLLDLVAATKVSDPGKELDKNMSIKGQLEQTLNLLRNDSIDKIGTIQHLDSALKDPSMQFFSFIDNKPINDLSTKMNDLYIERGKVLRSYNEKSDRIKLIDNQLNDTYRLLKTEVRMYRESLAEQFQIIMDKIANIESRLKTLDLQNVALQKQMIDSQRISRELKVQEFSYETFSKRREEAMVNNNVSNTNLANVTIMSKAFPSDGPVFPKKRVVITLGLLLGFITGCSFGFLREFFDHTFKKPSDVENYAGLPMIFSIPDKSEGNPS